MVTVTIIVPTELVAIIVAQGFANCDAYFTQEMQNLLNTYKEGLKSQVIVTNAAAISADADAVEAGISVSEV